MKIYIFTYSKYRETHIPNRKQSKELPKQKNWNSTLQFLFIPSLSSITMGHPSHHQTTLVTWSWGQHCERWGYNGIEWLLYICKVCVTSRRGFGGIFRGYNHFGHVVIQYRVVGKVKSQRPNLQGRIFEFLVSKYPDTYREKPKFGGIKFACLWVSGVCQNIKRRLILKIIMILSFITLGWIDSQMSINFHKTYCLMSMSWKNKCYITINT